MPLEVRLLLLYICVLFLTLSRDLFHARQSSHTHTQRKQTNKCQGIKKCEGAAQGNAINICMLKYTASCKYVCMLLFLYKYIHINVYKLAGIRHLAVKAVAGGAASLLVLALLSVAIKAHWRRLLAVGCLHWRLGGCLASLLAIIVALLRAGSCHTIFQRAATHLERSSAAAHLCAFHFRYFLFFFSLRLSFVCVLRL